MASPALMVRTPSGTAGVRDGEPHEPDPHALDREGPGRQGLLGEDAQELLAAVAVERVSAARLRLQLLRHRLEDHVAGLVAVACRCRP